MNLIFLLKKKIGLLYIRLSLIYYDYANKTDYERNESMIKEIETLLEIEKIKLQVKTKEQELINNIYFEK